MERLYSKRALIIKAVFCILLSPLYVIISSLINIENVFIYVIISAIPTACLYTIPFWLSLHYIIEYRIAGKIGKYILLDLGVCFAPAVLGILFSEVIYTVANKSTDAAGIITVIFSAIFIITTLIFWLFYFVFSRKK